MQVVRIYVLRLGKSKPASTDTPRIPKIIAMHIYLNIDLFPKIWEKSLAEKSIKIKPTVPKMIPK